DYYCAVWHSNAYIF
nr:immunoglobulin light chain junction region [Macaca mulatta]MOX79902.1 immunoglobulin light chain junction region [Macaca mulatta]MOX80546.1 immunoglobulin light chain junction region [Macaca mulatta]MOX80659.1 immunoglobulin light chain junction region [Macaca mulatta]MOX80796.1 immunoglobulin light chain junction region [Macaca mulatta]